jgi:hypothetical protein
MTINNVPNVPVDPMFEVKDNNVVMTSVGKSFFESFINYFFENFSNEGLVAPTQNTANSTIIQNNMNNASPTPQFTCGYGRLLYNSDTNQLMVSFDNGVGQPVFVNLLTELGPDTNAFLLL